MGRRRPAASHRGLREPVAQTIAACRDRDTWLARSGLSAGGKRMSARERHSLLGRLLLRTGVVVAALLFASGMVSYIVALHYSDEVHDRWLDDSARTLATQIRYVAQQPALDLPEVALEMFVWDEQDEIYFEVTARNNRRVAGNA